MNNNNKITLVNEFDKINLNDLAKLAQSNPKYAPMLKGLYDIDVVIKKFVEDTIENYSDASVYYIKTELMNRCYNLYLFSIERRAIVGVSWELSDFLIKCESKLIEKDVETKTLKMLEKFNQSKLMLNERINWIN